MKTKMIRVFLRELRSLPLPSEARKWRVDGHEVIDVTLPSQIMELAKIIAAENFKRATEKHSTRRIDEEGFNTVEDAELGAQGELAFALAAFGDWHQALTYMEDTFGRYDNMFRDFTIDVKTRGPCTSYSYLLILKKHLLNNPNDIYVGCSKIYGEEAPPNIVRIWGYATLKEMLKADKVNLDHAPDRGLEYNKTHKIRNLLKLPHRTQLFPL